MLLEFKCSNHKSIKETVTFSMLAIDDNTHKESLKELDNLMVSRSSVIYGANGSGKSNFIDAMAFMRHFVISSLYFQPGDNVPQNCHKLSNNDIPSEYYIQFVFNDVRYAYGFSIKQHKVNDEYLYYFPKGRKVKIFERDGMKIRLGSGYKNNFWKNSNGMLKENKLFLSCAANFSNIKEIEEAYLFFRNGIVIYNPISESENNNWMKYSMEAMHGDDKKKKQFIKIMKGLGTGIKDVKIDIEKVKFSELPEEVQNQYRFNNLGIPQEGYNKAMVSMVYDKFATNVFGEESAGVKQLFQIICPVLEILETSSVFICDELEKSLHEAIIYQIIKHFQYLQKDKCAQLIFSTHNTNLLNADLFRKDQVWFTELNDERATELYSLAEIKNVRKLENFADEYISGKYGAVPMLNKRMLKI